MSALIDWQPIEEMPEDRKDGRAVLVWAGGRPFVASYYYPENGDEGRFGMHEFDLADVTHWADISPPGWNPDQGVMDLADGASSYFRQKG